MAAKSLIEIATEARKTVTTNARAQSLPESIYHTLITTMAAWYMYQCYSMLRRYKNIPCTTVIPI